MTKKYNPKESWTVKDYDEWKREQDEKKRKQKEQADKIGAAILKGMGKGLILIGKGAEWLLTDKKKPKPKKKKKKAKGS